MRSSRVVGITRLVGLAALLASAGILGTAPADAVPEAVQVIDRTVRCSTSPSGGIWEVEARANAGFKDGSSWQQLPFGAASSGNATFALGDSLAWITAGKPSADSTMDVDFRRSVVREWGTLGVSRMGCRSVNAIVPLTPAGLQGGAVSAIGDKLDCPAPRHVLVHVRAIATAKTNLRAREDLLRTNVPLKSAQLAVRTEKGKPIMYTDVVETGKARLFTAKGCVLD